MAPYVKRVIRWHVTFLYLDFVVKITSYAQTLVLDLVLTLWGLLLGITSDPPPTNSPRLLGTEGPFTKDVRLKRGFLDPLPLRPYKKIELHSNNN